METYIIASIMVVVLYITYEIHKDRKRRGKNGIPILGYIYDSITVNVREEILDECCEEDSGVSSKSAGKKHGNKKRHSQNHKHHKCSKKHNKQRKSSKNLQLGSTAMELVEESTQKSEKSDRKRKSSKAFKKQEKANDSMNVVKCDLIPAPVKKL
uniref:Uncharacterized protein n=1 Tax=Panagrolaimus davidi TaxID=227884 RepID=A0A914RDQ1_9BILA